MDVRRKTPGICLPPAKTGRKAPGKATRVAATLRRESGAGEGQQDMTAEGQAVAAGATKMVLLGGTLGPSAGCTTAVPLHGPVGLLEKPLLEPTCVQRLRPYHSLTKVASPACCRKRDTERPASLVPFTCPSLA